MVERDRLWPAFGDLNAVEDEKIGRLLDPLNTSPWHIMRESMLSVFKKDAFQNSGPLRGIVLRVEQNPNNQEPDSWLSRVFGKEKTKTLTILKVRIPEIHAALPEPANYGNNAGASNKVIDMYPSFIAINEEVSNKPVAPGDIVLVDFGNRVNLSDPIYLGPILSSPTPGVVGQKAAKKTFDDNKGTFLANQPFGDAIFGVKNILNQLPIAIQGKQEGTQTMNQTPQSQSLPPLFKPLTSETLKQIMPQATNTNIQKYLDPLNQAMATFEMNTPQRQAAFLAQIALESGELKFDTELPSVYNGYDFTKYDGRKDLGNTQPGDGPKFKGRGLLQLTGRYNYGKTTQKLNVLGIAVDLVEHPELASRSDISTTVAGIYFRDHNLNALADRGDIVGISRSVNGGNLGLQRRIAYYNKGLEVLNKDNG